MRYLKEVTVSSIQKTTWVKNPLSGHEWPEYGPITAWEVRGPIGHISKHRTKAKAESVAKEWREFYEKHPIEVND